MTPTRRTAAQLVVTYTLSSAPTIANLSGDSLAYNVGSPATVIEQGGNATVSDIDSANFDTGTLTVSFAAGGVSTQDVLAIRTGAGQIGVSGANVTYAGTTIGTFAGGSSGANLIITLNANANSSNTAALIQNITYQNTNTSVPTMSARTVRFALTDGDGGTSANHDITVNVTSSTLAVVTTNLDTADANDGDTSSIAALNANKGTDGLISLREAITAANNTLGADTIRFNIAGTGVHTITLTYDGPDAGSVPDALPTITGAVTIDATTDDSFAANGNRPAIELSGTGAGAVNGLVLAAGSNGSTIRGLVVQNFNQSGILVQSTGNTIAGNYIGLDADGTTVSANNVSNTSYLGGIRVESNNNTIGGLSAADRNVISGNGYAGIVFVNASANQVLGNYIGTDAGGTLDRGNQQEGIDINRGGGNSIGGANVNARNVISGNDSDGIEIDGSVNNVVQGNYIGTDYTGTLDVGNTRDGIDMSEDVDNSLSSTGNLIGGTGLNEGNLLFGNDIKGIEIRDTSTIGNTILGNRIFGNANLGIDLVGGTETGGVTANDPAIDMDSDTGANNLQNFPVLSTANVNGTQITITGTLNSTANSYFRVEFFASATADGSTYGEGQRYLGFANVTTDASGNATINTDFDGNCRSR